MKTERSTPQNLNSKFLGPAAPGLKQAGPPSDFPHTHGSARASPYYLFQQAANSLDVGFDLHVRPCGAELGEAGCDHLRAE